MNTVFNKDAISVNDINQAISAGELIITFLRVFNMMTQAHVTVTILVRVVVIPMHITQSQHH